MVSDLSYFVPHHGRPKISLCIPESFNLYVCPPACVRRVSIRALRNGSRSNMGFLYLSEADVVSGSYEGAVLKAVKEALEMFERAPRAFLIHLNCIDDFLGTDEDVLLRDLRTRFPQLSFMVVHMNPIAADRGLSTGLRIHERLYRMLEPADVRDKAVNLVGNFVGLDDGCELAEFLNLRGITQVRELFSCEDFDAYQSLAASRLNLVLAGIGLYAAERMEARLGIPFLNLPVEYALDGVRMQYRALSEALDRVGCMREEDVSKLFAAAEAQARKSVAGALAAVGDTPVVVDSSAVMRPFALAKALVSYGFVVKAVFALHLKDHDAQERAWLASHCPDVEVIYEEGYGSLLRRGISRDTLCIGFDSAYLLKARRFVDVQKDEGMFGYYAVERLMNLMAVAMTAEPEGE